MLCPTCQSENRPDSKFCRRCGNKLPQEKTPEQFSSPIKTSDSFSQSEIKEPSESKIIGLSEIQARLKMFITTLNIKSRQRKIGMPLNDSTSVLIFRGETGTGKSLVAENFIFELKKSNCLCSQNVEITTAHKFQRRYKFDVDISKYLLEKNFGILCIEEIHNDENYLHELLLGLTEKKLPTICILLGIKEPLEKFFNKKPELADLVSFYDFPNITDLNLSKILENKLRENGFVFDEEVKELFLPCVEETKNNSATIYKNGWIVEKEIMRRISENQASRLSKKSTCSSDDLKRILKEDLPVSKKIQTVDEILSQLDELIGMKSVKSAVRQLCHTILNNQKRKELGISTENPKIHIVLTGNPGTGKTTVSRILGKLFFAMKLLPSDKVIEIDGLGLTAGYVGQTKDKVNELCDKAMGGVLFIDEAYYLSGSEGGSNSYGSEAVGTLLKRMEDDRGKFIIIAAGYQNEMQNFLKMNPGLESRFEHKIHIEDYTDSELCQIFDMNVRKANFLFGESAREKVQLAISELCKNKGKDFANAREIRNLFDSIKLNMDSRISLLAPSALTKAILTTIQKEDIPLKEKKQLTIDEVFAELNELIGMEKVKEAVYELYDTVKINQEMEQIGQKPKKPEIHISLTGNPGTGKTTVARIFGKLFNAMGLLPSEKLVETDRSKIVGKYEGHTAANMQRLCDDATGGILFIDEVYTLATDDYGREASDTLMKRMEDDRGKFIVVVAGYKDKMQNWMSTNEGLPSRFTHHIHIEDYNVQELCELFSLYVRKEKLNLTDEAKIVAGEIIFSIWENKGSDFANGRTIRKLFDAVVRRKNSRIMKLQKEERTKEVLTTIFPEDFDFEEGLE